MFKEHILKDHEKTLDNAKITHSKGQFLSKKI